LLSRLEQARQRLRKNTTIGISVYAARGATYMEKSKESSVVAVSH
jgi:hypothetical protein